jgi:hypothetical protein
MASRGAAFEIEDLMDTVPIKNRVTDGKVCVVFDRRQIVWAPGEVKGMPRKVAEWFIRKSMYKFTPGDENRGIRAKTHHTLVIVGGGKDETPMTNEQRTRPELIDRESMTSIDLNTGKPMKTVYIDPNRVAGVDALDGRAKVGDKIQERAVETISGAIMAQTVGEVGKIADALPESVIGDGVEGQE